LRAKPFAAVDDVVDAALGTRFTAAVVRVERGGRLVHEAALGATSADAFARPIDPTTRFDLASLSKVILAAAVLRAVDDGALALDASVDALHEWRSRDDARTITWRMLLAHTSGLQSGADYRTLLREEIEAYALAVPLKQRPGAGVIYSDIGFIALGVAYARLCGTSLASALADGLAPFGTPSLGYRPRAAERLAIPATECDGWRGRVRGTVHDEKAALAGGVAGHAGLFGSARDVARIAEAFLAPARGRPSALAASLAAEAVTEQAFDPILRRGLGWALKTTETNSCGTVAGPRTFGHTGFTGTCVWADPDRDASVVFLTNGVYFGRTDLRDVRAAVCDAAFAAIDAGAGLSAFGRVG
jgi:CubicO group peptidase (beta-lactamase class C family)